ISQHRVDVEQASASVLDRSTAELLATNLSASDPNDILYALSLFEVERQRAAHPVIRSLLSHPAAPVRQKALAILAASGDKTVRPDVEGLLRDPDLNVRTEALLYLTHHAHVDPLLSRLWADPDTAVVRKAIGSVGKLRKRRLVPELLDRLAHRELGAEAAKALGGFGDTIVGALRDHLSDYSVAIEARREIPAVLVKVGSSAAAQVLMENLLESDTTLRFRIISALNKLHRLHPEIE